MSASKGFVAAVLGGFGGGMGAIAGGLILGVAEAMTAGYISSSYKDAMPFVLILLILFFRPQGLFGKKGGGSRMKTMLPSTRGLLVLAAVLAALPLVLPNSFYMDVASGSPSMRSWSSRSTC